MLPIKCIIAQLKIKVTAHRLYSNPPIVKTRFISCNFFSRFKMRITQERILVTQKPSQILVLHGREQKNKISS